MIHASFNNASNLLHLTFPRRNLQKKLCYLPALCRSTPNDDSSSEGSQPQGDPKKQELLAKIAMLQAQKYRLTDYLDERSAYLTQFAEEANAEIDAIGESALKDLDEASARIMENIESKMQAFEESSEISKEEIAERDKELAEFEGDIIKGRNEGLFFQSLALTGLMAIGIADSFTASPPDWKKIAVLAAVFVGLLSQFFYEQNTILNILKEKPHQIDLANHRANFFRTLPLALTTPHCN